jgi:hypothetical protein
MNVELNEKLFRDKKRIWIPKGKGTSRLERIMDIESQRERWRMETIEKSGFQDYMK